MIGRRARRPRPGLVLAALLLAGGVAAGCAAGGGSAPASGDAAPADQPLRGLDAYIADAVNDWGVAGLSIAVVKDGEVVFAEGYGRREAGSPGPVDEGLMEWDDPATEHLPWFQLHDPYVTREITLRDLLSHRSGLGRRGDMLWYGSEYDRGELLRRVRYLEPNSSFRSEFGYQNLMFLAAGEATAAAAGRSWDALIEDRIFAPLGMDRSNTSTTALTDDPNVASPHIRSDGTLTPVPWRNLDNVAPAGSINSSAAEMAEWLRMLLADGVLAGDTLVRPRTLQEIFTPQTLRASPSDTLFPSVHFSAYGLGMGIQDYRGRKVLVHTGGIDGMLSMVGLIPEEDLGVVVLTNTSGGNNLFTALVYTVFDRYLGAGPIRDWSAVLLDRQEAARQRLEEAEGEGEEERVAGTSLSLPLTDYAGTYAHPMYGEAEVTVEDGALVLRRGPAFTGDLEHWHFDTFRAEWRHPGMGSAMVTFILDFDGSPDSMQVDGFGEFERVPETDRGSE